MKRHRFLSGSLIALLALVAFALPIQRGSVAGSALAEAATSSASDSPPSIGLARQSQDSHLGQVSALGETTGGANLASLPHSAGEGRERGASAVMFIENVGQFADGARFQVRGADKTIWLAEDGLWVTVVEKPSSPQPPSPNLGEGGEAFPSPRFGRAVEGERQPSQGVHLRLSFPGANPHPPLEPFNRLETHVSYFIGNDPEKWHANVPVWGGVRYKDLYPGIDLEITSENGRVVQRLVTQHGADLSAVRLRIEGADAVELLPSPSGSGAGGDGLLPSPRGRGGGGEGLFLRTSVGNFTLPLLTVEALPPERAQIQRLNGQAFDIKAPFASVSSLTLPLSPQDNPSDLLYATFLGGSYSDVGYDIAVDDSGSAYITGWTNSFDFPVTPGAYDQTFNGTYYDGDTFVMKFNAASSGLIYATFLGGSGSEFGHSIDVDSNGSAYITGHTSSFDFPVTQGAFDITQNGERDAFITKLNTNGSAILYSTFIGGSDWDSGEDIVVDIFDMVYVTGFTHSSDFVSKPGAFDTTYNGGSDAFVVKLKSDGSDLVYATFLGGSNEDNGDGITVDGSGSAYITGDTRSSDFPIDPGSFDFTFNGLSDGFIVKLNPSGSALAYVTYLGGSDWDGGNDITVDNSGAAYVTGFAWSLDFPTTLSSFQPSHKGYSDVFVAKLNMDGSKLIYATFLGGWSSGEEGYSIIVDEIGAAYVTGVTYSSDFPTTPGAFDTTCDICPYHDDAFVVKLNATGSALSYATFLGGSSYD